MTGPDETGAGRGRHRRAAPTGGRRRGGPLRLVAVVASALCVPAVAAVVVLALRDRADAATQSARGSAVAAARVAAHDLLSYDYRSLDRDIARAKSETTGPFAQQYAGTADRLLTQARQLHAIVQASVGTPGVVSGSRDQVVVLVFVDQASVKQLPGKTSPTTRIDQSRVRLTMTRVGGRWLVSQLDAL